MKGGPVKLRVVLPVLALAALLPSGAAASTVHGVVVGEQHGLLLVAAANGLVQPVRGRASIGARIAGTAVVGHSSRARIRGIVIKRIGTTMIVSSNKHLLAIHSGRKLMDVGSSPTTPGPGAVVDTTVGVHANGELDEENEEVVGQVSGTIPVQATITGVGSGTVTLSVNGTSVTVDLPAGLTLPSSLVGQTAALTISLGNDEGDGQGDDDHGGDGGGDG